MRWLLNLVSEKIFLGSFYAKDTLRLQSWGSNWNWFCLLLLYKLKPFKEVQIQKLCLKPDLSECQKAGWKQLRHELPSYEVKF